VRDKQPSLNENTFGKPMAAVVQLVFESQRETTRKNWRHEERKTRREKDKTEGLAKKGND